VVAALRTDPERRLELVVAVVRVRSSGRCSGASARSAPAVVCARRRRRCWPRPQA
jgi:hypothetical protein